ncbi:Abi family protein [Reichenbachiella versicolor]|uniref:Abi family protein n=1 Tax=Reichenbachiella versicolor TaxID=1821036 RepID=UPI000D6E1222|nr:Abi family protein [Reichenbachiella versicolor]
MAKRDYHKPALTVEQQLIRLKERGLSIEHESKAVHILQNISYFRLSGYWYPLLQEPKTDHRFKDGASFEQAFKLYCFDRELRFLITGELEKIEIAIRTQLIYQMSHYKGAYWFQDESLFRNRNKLDNTLDKMRHEYAKSDELFISSFNDNYSNELPPSWMLLEVVTFGKLSNLYSNLNPGKSKRKIARYFGLDDRILTSWLHSFNYIRNICAHHARFWNKTLGISPKVPFRPSNQFLTLKDHQRWRNDKPAFGLSMILYFLNTINPNHTFKQRFNSLLEKYPDVDASALGFPTDWKNQELWK